MTYQEDFTLPTEYLEQIGEQGLEYLPELIRILVNAAMQVERQKHLGAGWHERSAEQDSHVDGLLDCPHYTRPEVIDGMRVPQVLLGGDHEAIRLWRLQQSLGRTWLRRPELLEQRGLSAQERDLLDQFIFAVKRQKHEEQSE
jgi:tRNA G37 N-methylase TrmD